MGNGNIGEHWTDISKIWAHVGPPLRPSGEDINFIQSSVCISKKCSEPFNIAILGVTPEYYHMQWPGEKTLVAVDHTQEMINKVWPGPPEMAICVEWTNLPFESESVDMILCDGGLHLLSFPVGQKKLVSEIRRVLKPKGVCIFRLFLPPKEKESSSSVLRQLLDGELSSLNILKLKLWPALQANKYEGVNVHDIWNAVFQTAPDFNQLAADLGWEKNHLFVLNSYQNSAKKYYMLTLEEVTEMFESDPGGFHVQEIKIPSYELGERCPTITLRKR